MCISLVDELFANLARRTDSNGSKPPLKRSSTRGPRPSRALDARSLGATQAGAEPVKILRSPRLRNNRNGTTPAGRKPKAAASKSKTAASKSNSKAQKTPRARGPKRQSEAADIDELHDAEFDKIEEEQIWKARPGPVRYDPQEIDFSSLRETWPSIPTDSNAQSAAVFEKMSRLSGRFPNGYTPPHELGRRLWKGQSVLFTNEAEKAEAMEEAKRLAQVRADLLSQKKGEPVEPSDVTFNPIDAKDTKGLMEMFVSGKYPSVDAEKGQSPVMSDVMRNLRNNQTWQTTGKSPQFVAKLQSLLPANSNTKSSP